MYWIFIGKGTRNLLGKLRSSNGSVRQVNRFTFVEDEDEIYEDEDEDDDEDDDADDEDESKYKKVGLSIYGPSRPMQ